MKQVVTRFGIFMCATSIGLILCLTSCVTLTPGGAKQSAAPSTADRYTPDINYPDPCSKNLQQLEMHKKSTPVVTEFSDLAKCITKCEAGIVTKSTAETIGETIGSIFGRDKNEQKPRKKDVDCSAKCNKEFDADKITNSFIMTSEEESKRLRSIKQSISHLQNCRNIEANRIRAALRSKDSSQRDEAISKYKAYKMRIEDDNHLIASLLKSSDERIKGSEDAAREAGIIASGSASVQLAVKPGFSIRTKPSKNGKIVGKTSKGTVDIHAIDGDWVRLKGDRPAYVHRSAFPSIKLTPKQEAELAHAQTRDEYKNAQNTQYDYEKEMDKELAEIDDAIEATT